MPTLPHADWMPAFLPLAAPLIAFIISLIVLRWLTRTQFALDHPNERSLHETPVPRSGGIGLYAGVLVAWGLVQPHLPVAFWFSLVMLWIISWLDDTQGLPVSTRLAAHVLAAGMLSLALLFYDFGLPAVLGATLVIAWMIELYNFMDGADGLAGGMALFGFGAYGIAAWFAGSTSFAWLNFSIAAAALAFLIFNFHPAKIFLGDVGAIPLGFLAGGFGLVGWLQRDWTWWFPLLVFSPFIVDASVTLIRRAFARARIWQAHRDHYYQRLVQLGWGHRNTALAEYALMLACGGVGLFALGQNAGLQTALLAIVAGVYLMFIVLIEYAWRKHVHKRTTA